MRGSCLVPVMGCVPSLSAPSVYSEADQVCDDPAAFGALVDDCALDPACAGITSLAGEIEGSPFVLTSPLYQAVLRLADEPPQLAQLDLFGVGPYFEFALSVESVGGLVDGTAESRALEYVFDAEDLPDHLADNKANAEIRVSIPRRTLILVAQPTSGTWTARTQTRDRIELSFDALFGADGDAIRGCATVHPLEVRRE